MSPDYEVPRHYDDKSARIYRAYDTVIDSPEHTVRVYTSQPGHTVALCDENGFRSSRYIGWDACQDRGPMLYAAEDHYRSFLALAEASSAAWKAAMAALKDPEDVYGAVEDAVAQLADRPRRACPASHCDADAEDYTTHTTPDGEHKVSY